MIQLTEQFPEFELEGFVSLERDQEFETFPSDRLKADPDTWTVFFWWPRDFTRICPTEVAGFNTRFQEFADRKTQIFGASTDSKYMHLGWCRATEELQGLHYPLLADPEKDLARRLGILDEESGLAFRATFIVDPSGMVRWISVYDMNIGRSIDEVIRVLDALQTEEMCPCDWRRGKPTIKPEPGTIAGQDA